MEGEQASKDCRVAEEKKEEQRKEEMIDHKASKNEGRNTH